MSRTNWRGAFTAMLISAMLIIVADLPAPVGPKTIWWATRERSLFKKGLHMNGSPLRL